MRTGIPHRFAFEFDDISETSGGEVFLPRIGVFKNSSVRRRKQWGQSTCGFRINEIDSKRALWRFVQEAFDERELPIANSNILDSKTPILLDD